MGPVPRRLVSFAWVPALALALAFLAVDSGRRLEGIAAVSGIGLAGAPQVEADRASPSGFEARQHRLVLPSAGTDGYQWILQAEEVLAEGSSRVRHTSLDNAPDGREVHWSTPARWWLATLAHVRMAARPELTPGRALEQVAPGAGAVALALVLLAVTPVLAWRLGPLAASLFAVGWVALFPLYETFLAGVVDHHGFVAVTAACTLLCLVAGGGGWVGDAAAAGRGGRGAALSERRACAWFVAAGVWGGLGLWISAVSMVPVVAAAALGAILAAPGREGAGASTLRPAPALWRAWGVAGCATSLAAYAFEYAPAHLALRLEVNHPLYALAWLGIGEVVAQLWERRSRSVPARPRLVRIRVAVGLILAAGPGLALLLSGGEALGVSSPFLRALHAEGIREFQPLARHLAGAAPVQAVQSVSLLPLVLLPVAGLLLRREAGGRAPLPFLALSATMACAAAAFVVTLALSSPPAAGVAGAVVAVAVAAAAVAVLGGWLPGGAEGSDPSARGKLAVAGAPSALLLALALGQVRWLPTASAVLLALLAAGCAAVRFREGGGGGAGRRWVLLGLLVAMLAPFPLATALVPWRTGYGGAGEAAQLLTRDLAHRLRAETGLGEVVVAAPPTTTMWLIWFGGFRGVGTLYWENRAGLEDMALLAAAREEGAFRRILEERGVTHLVVPSWEPFPEAAGTLTGADEGGGGERLLDRIVSGDTIPGWLVPMSYHAPDAPPFRGLTARVFSVRFPTRRGGFWPVPKEGS